MRVRISVRFGARTGGEVLAEAFHHRHLRDPAAQLTALARVGLWQRPPVPRAKAVQPLLHLGNADGLAVHPGRDAHARTSSRTVSAYCARPNHTTLAISHAWPGT